MTRNAVGVKKRKAVFNTRVQEGFMEEMGPQRMAKEGKENILN